MAKFSFRLRALLSVRCTERDARRAELAAALAEERQWAERRRGVEGELNRQLARTAVAAGPGIVDLGMLRTAKVYEAALRAELTSFLESETAAAREVSRCQDVLAAADGEVRALEKLRERQQGAFCLDTARADLRASDELAAR
jgi:flagellar export protein FliJ